MKALLDAIAAGDSAALIQAIGKYGADAFDEDERVPVVSHAADTGDVALVQPFLDAGVAVDLPDGHGRTLLFSAVSAPSLPLTEFLIARGADVNHRMELDGDTVLTYAMDSIRDGSPLIIVDALLRAGADPNTPRSDGWTPLMMIAQEGDVEVARALLAAGADPRATKGEGTTAADIAAHWQQDGIAELLAEHGAQSPVDVCVARLSGLWDGRGVEPAEVAALEAVVGHRLPADLHAYLLLYGATDDLAFHEYQGLRVDRILGRWQGLEELRLAGTFDAAEPKELSADNQRVQHTWWHPGWLPFAEDGGGNLYCVDLAPAEFGARGQVIAWEVHAGPCGPLAPSLEDFLRRIRQGLSPDTPTVDVDDGPRKQTDGATS